MYVYDYKHTFSYPKSSPKIVVLKTSNSRELEFGGPYRDRTDYLPVMSGTLIPLKLKALWSAMPDSNWRPID